jgi:NAD(P)-dependent dehydrogenase (short-subunit alcohol dehydrogenase family)
MEDLRGKHVLVTGATGGAGPTLVSTLLVSGATVTAAARRRTALDALRADHPRSDRLHVAEADVSGGEHVEALLDSLERGTGPLDGVVHAVGGYAHGPLAELTEGTVDLLCGSLFRSAVLVLRGALRRMLPRGRGRVVLMGALAAERATPDAAVYGALKAAVGHLAQSAAAEAGGRGVTVNAVLPGPMDTSPNRARAGGAGGSRWTAPADVARVVAMLLGDTGRGINGALVAVPGEV